jgi:hypothetical protein
MYVFICNLIYFVKGSGRAGGVAHKQKALSSNPSTHSPSTPLPHTPSPKQRNGITGKKVDRCNKCLLIFIFFGISFVLQVKFHDYN